MPTYVPTVLRAGDSFDIGAEFRLTPAPEFRPLKRSLESSVLELQLKLKIVRALGRAALDEALRRASKQLFLARLPPVPQSKIRSALENFGAIGEFQLIKGGSCGFVSYVRAADGERALQGPGIYIDGRRIVIRESVRDSLEILKQMARAVADEKSEPESPPAPDSPKRPAQPRLRKDSESLLSSEKKSVRQERRTRRRERSVDRRKRRREKSISSRSSPSRSPESAENRHIRRRATHNERNSRRRDYRRERSEES